MVPNALPLLAATDAAELARGTTIAVVAIVVLVLGLGLVPLLSCSVVAVIAASAAPHRNRGLIRALPHCLWLWMIECATQKTSSVSRKLNSVSPARVISTVL